MQNSTFKIVNIFYYITVLFYFDQPWWVHSKSIFKNLLTPNLVYVLIYIYVCVIVTSRRDHVHNWAQLSPLALGQTGLAQGLKMGLHWFVNAEKITLQEST